MIMKNTVSLHLPSNVRADHLADLASFCSMKREIVVFTSACLRSGLDREKLGKRQIQTSIYNVVNRSKYKSEIPACKLNQ